MNIETEMFAECNAHLKETDKKRDQLLAIFIIAIGLLFANLGKLGDSKTLILSLFSALGVFLIAAVIQYRKWHINYARAAQAVAFFMLEDGKPVRDRIDAANNRLISKGYMARPGAWFNPLASTEAAILMLSIGLAAVPTMLLLMELSLKCRPILIACVSVLYLSVSIGICYQILRAANQKSPFEIWLLKPILWAAAEDERE